MFFINTKTDEKILEIIEQHGVARFIRCFKFCGGVLSISEVLLIINLFLTSSGGPYTKIYFSLYLFILLVALLGFFLILFTKKMSVHKRTKILRAYEIFFMFAIEAWAVGITYIDAVTHNLLDLLIYISALTLLPSLIFISPFVGVPFQVIFDALIYFAIPILDPNRTKFLFINFTTYAGIAILIYILTYKIQYELYEREAQLKKAAEIDSLTELSNRFSYSTYIQMLKDHPENRQFAILLLDLNGLKIANDTRGHNVGDELIKATAWCIKKAFHKNGVCFRTGGDEFVVILNKRLNEIPPMIHTFESLCKNWKGEIISSPSVSYGLAEALAEPNLNVDQLIELADSRMYLMKQQYYNDKSVNRRKEKDQKKTN